MKKLFVFFLSVMFFCWAHAQSPVQLSVQMQDEGESICGGEFQIEIGVSNASNNDATNVKCKLNLPSYVSIVNPADTVILFPSVVAGDYITYSVRLRNSGSFGVAASIPLMCQIWSCDQPDAESLAYGQWDWTGSPNRLGARVDVPVMNTASSSDIQITSAEVCYGGTAVLKASAPNLLYPQNFVWYSSDLHTVLLQEEIGEGGESQLLISDCSQNETYYVTMANEELCPVTLLYNYSTLLLNENINGQTTQLAHDDCIYFYDEGGKKNKYPSRNQVLTHSFQAALQNDILYLSFTSLNLGNNDVLYVYDGSSVDAPLLAALTVNSSVQDVQNIHSSGQFLTVQFEQNNTTAAGWEAEIKAKQEIKQISTVLLNAQQDGQVTTVSPLDSILFYDEGGETGAYALNSDLSCTFTSMMGNVRADFTGIGANLRLGDSLIVYDGSSTDAPILHFFVSSSPRYPVLTSTGQSLTFRLVTHASSPGAGWRAQITSVNPENSMAKATVSIKAPSSVSSLIETTDGEACYAQEASLTATSNIQGPQYFTWYAPDMSGIVYRDTVATAGDESVFSVETYENTTYYVSVASETECPMRVPIYSTVLLNGSSNNKTTVLSEMDYVNFYDAGGENNGYNTSEGNDLKHTFTAESGEVYISFSDYIYQCGSTLSVYDGTVADENHLLVRYENGETYFDTPDIYQSTQGSLTVVMHAIYDCYCPSGWKALVYTQEPQISTVLLDAVHDGGTTSVGLNEKIKFYDGGGEYGTYSTNTSYTHTFTAQLGNVQALVKSRSIGSGDYLFIYDGEDETADLLRTYGQGTSYNQETITSSGKSMTFKLISDNSNADWGWNMEISAVNPQASMATVSANVKASQASTLTITDAEACYGSEAILTASSNIEGTKTFVWYSPDRLKVVKEETISSGESSFSVVATESTTYYVVVSNECPIVEPLHNNYHEILMNRYTNTYNLSANDSIGIFDAGGKDGDYEQGESYGLHINAPTGSHIRLHFNSVVLRESCHLEIKSYDDNDNEYEISSLYRVANDLDFLIENNSAYINFVNWGGETAAGWDAYAYAIVPHDISELAEAHVNIKPFPLDSITMTGTEVCYGNETTVTATASINYPQTFIWYNSDRKSKLKEETIIDGGSSLTLTPTEETTYYVTVTNANNCPYIEETIHNNYREVLMGHIREVYLSKNDSIGYFDPGGKDGGFVASDENYTSTVFRAPEGSYIKVYFKTIDMPNTHMEVRDHWGITYGQISGIDYNREFIIEDNYAQLWINGYSVGASAGGWNAYVYAINPKDVNDFYKVSFTFVEPAIAQNIHVDDVEACYGEHVTLSATADMPYPQYYAWFDSELNLLKQERIEDGESNLDVYATENTKYYVNVSSGNACPVLSPTSSLIEELLLNESTSGQTTTVMEGHPINFYDDGGKNGEYSNSANWSHYFKAEEGKQVVLQVLEFASENNYDKMYVYDVGNNTMELIGELIGGQWSEEYISTDGMLKIEWHSDERVVGAGWKAIVRIVGDDTNPTGMSDVNISIKHSQANSIVTEDDTVCPDQEAVLKASSNIATPQTFVWYSPDRHTVLKRETITSGVSEYSFIPEQADTYYVAITNEENCPIVEGIHPNYKEVLMGDESSTYFLFPTDSIGFFDKGGKDGTYYPTSSQDVDFYAPEGAHIRIHFNTVRLNQTSYRVNDGQNDIGTVSGQMNDADFVVESNHLRFRTYGTTSGLVIEEGWDAYVYAIMPQDESNLAQASVKLKSGMSSSVITEGAVVCNGNEATLTATSTIAYPQYYSWYSPDRLTVLQRDTVTEGYSSFTVQPATEGNYYVTVYNDTTCPVSELTHSNYRELLMDGNQTRCDMAPKDSIVFFDGGGRTESYYDRLSYECWFSAPEGSLIRVHIDTISINDGSLYIEDENNVYYARFSSPCHKANLDYVIPVDKVKMRIYTYGGAVDWQGYIYPIAPQDESVLTPAKVSFKKPDVSSSIQIDDVEACYGENVTLTATNGSGTFRYVWYDESYNLLKEETGENSTLEVRATPNKYYVNAGGPNECLSLPPHYGELWFDASMNGDTTTFATGEYVKFYDAGGPNDSYKTPGADWVHTFIAPAGKQVTLQLNKFWTNCGHVLRIYDGTKEYNYGSWSYDCNYGEMHQTITSQSGQLTVRWSIDNNEGNYYSYLSGWDAIVGVKDEHGEMNNQYGGMAYATIRIKPSQVFPISITGNEMCYGSESTLTASANIASPQTFVWYSPDRVTVLKEETVVNGVSNYTLTPNKEETYYVAVTNAENCPIVETVHNQYREFLLLQNADNRTINLAYNDSLRFYDEGGKTGDYRNGNYQEYYVNAPAGSYIRVHFDTISFANNNTSLRMSNSSASKELSGPIHSSNLDYIFPTNQIRLYFYNYSDDTDMGWEGFIYAINPHDISELTPANISFQEPDITTLAHTSDVGACYGDYFTLEATADIPYSQHFAWYDSELNLLKQEIVTSGTSHFNVFVTEETKYYVNVTGEEGCPVLPPGYGRTTLLVDENNSGMITYVREGYPIRFYDSGGPDGRYSGYEDWDQTFKAEEGKQVTLNIQYFETDNCTNCDYMYIYDVIDGGEIQLDLLTTEYANLSYTSTNGKLRVVWHSDCCDNRSGWSAVVRTEGDESEPGSQTIDMSVVNVGIQQSITPDITFAGTEVCYGSEATILASSEINYPQYYTWYSSNRLTVLKRDTIEAGASAFTHTPGGEETYYVAVSNDNLCPIVEPLHTNYRELFLTMEDDENYTVGVNDSIALFDGGGKDTYYEANVFMERVRFSPSDESLALRLHFDTLNLGDAAVFMIHCSHDACPVSDILTGFSTNLDYVFEPPYNEIEMELLSMESTVDFSGYIYAIRPQFDDVLKEVTVRYKNAEISHSIQVDNVEACYGEEVVLSASAADVAYPQHFVWYDNDMRLLKHDIVTDGASSLTVTAWDNTTYYVNVSEENECPAIATNPDGLLFNETIDRQITTITEGHPIYFYDDGGFSRNYSTNANWLHYFKAEEGKQVALQLLSFASESCCDVMYVFDVIDIANEEYIPLGEIKGNVYGDTYGEMEFSSTHGILGVRWYSGGSNVEKGWKALVKISGEDVEELTSAQVSLKHVSSDASLIATNDTVCYGSDALLTVSSSLQGTQYYEWRSEDYSTVLKRDTVTNGTSTLILPEQVNESSYYINVHNEDACPMIKYNTGREYSMYLNEETNNQTTFLNGGDKVHFYDDGGPDGDYSPYTNARHTFATAADNYLLVHFGNFELSEMSGILLNAPNMVTGILTTDQLSYVSGLEMVLPSNSITIGLLNIDGSTASGFNIDITSLPSPTEYIVTLDENHHQDTTILPPAAMYYLVDNGGVEDDYIGGADYEHTFMAMQGTVSARFMSTGETPVQLNRYDTLYVYDSDRSLLASITESESDVFSVPELQSTGQSLTFRFVTHNVDGYGGFLVFIHPVCDTTELVKASVYLKQGGEGVDEMSICRRELPITLGSTILENTISSGTYEVVYPQASANGCDSIVALNVTVLENTTYTETKYIYGLPYTWYDTTFLPGTHSGTYEYHLDNQAGCDSAMILNLIVMCEPIVLSDTVDKVICAASVTLGNQTYTANGQYDITYYNILGCDSMETTNLVLNHPDNPAYVFTLNCPAAVYDTIRANECSVAPQLGMPTFEHHALAVIPSYVDSITITNNAPAEFPKGETVVLWTAVDNCGNTATCEQHVYIAMEDCPLAVDYEGNEYQTVRLGDDCLCWMAENLRSTQYSDGRPIDNVMSYSSELFPNEAANVSIYGHLYDWYAAADTATNSIDSVERAYALGKRIHGICPEGWYLPTDEDIERLNVYPAVDLRSTDYWLKGGGTNSTGFNAVPSGMYNCSTGRYEDMLGTSFYWSCHPVYDKTMGAMIDYICEKLIMQDIPRCSGLSVRCVNKEQ